MKKILLLTLALVTSLSFVAIFSESGRAIIEQSPGQKAASYCSTERKLTGQNLTNCKKAWDCGYTYWRERDKDHCKNSTNYQGLNIKKYATENPNGILVQAIADGKKDARAKNVKPSESSGNSSESGGGGSESAPGNTGNLGGDNKAESDGATEDGITVDGKDISASVIKLDSGDTPTNLKKATPEQFVSGLLNIVYSLAASIAVIVIVAAGIMYVISDGDPARTTRAKNAIIYAAVGLVITGSAFVITGIIQGIGAS
ncbi:hypothetical protein HY004_02460 [Candidatus Saccharibacteria bacterium]|nr:hypothetical protein [Candidatus Saccharibacteria bacterium]